jgi:acyl-CoA hydrolase
MHPPFSTAQGAAPARPTTRAVHEVHYVITEYGIAYLFGKSTRERALALIQIAHPRWREGLLTAAKQLGFAGGRPGSAAKSWSTALVQKQKLRMVNR